ncbi:MAG: HYR domain-containing protein [Ignavibacteriales bacterium]|nr:HYR domain-containing protein [Ignavibacteriales bacterium]
MRPIASRLMMFVSVMFVGMILCAEVAEASHFRYGHITWSRAAGTRNVTFTVTTAWRVSPFTRLNFGDGTFIDRSESQMTQIATGPDYAVWRYTVTHTYANDGPFTAFFESCCRIGELVNASNASFRVQNTVDLRNNNQGSPVSSIPVILQMVQGGPNTVPMAIGDPDNDPFTVRMSTAAESQVPSVPAGLAVSSSGVLTWNTSGTTVGQLYAAQVMIQENHPGGTSGLVALDFIIQIVGGTLNQPPTCMLSGPSSNVVNVGQNFSITITGTDPDGGNLTVNHFGLPPGATLTPSAGSSGPAPFAATFSWTPGPADAGTAQSVTISFSDPSGFQTQCSFSMQVPLSCPSGVTIAGSVPNFCQEDSQPVSLTLNGTNIGGATFSWSLIGPSPNPNLGTSQMLNTTLGGLAPGNYTIEGKVSTANCGSSVSVVNFVVFPSPTVAINGPAEVYQNESVVLTANVTTGFPPYNFSWNTGATSSSISPNTSILGTSSYTVTVKDGHGCDATATASLLVKPRPVPPFSFSVTPGHICLPPFMVQDPSTTHYWWAKAAGSGDLEIEFSAVSVNSLETGTATVRVYSPSNTLVASHTVPHPASGETPAPLIVIAGPAAGSIYRIEVNVAVPPPSVQGARHYRLELDGAEQLGTNSPLQAQAENESIRWGVNVLSGEPLNVNVQGGPEAPATVGSFEIRNPSGSLVTTSPLGSPVSISSTVPGMWTVTVTGLDHHVIVTKTTGADQGLYLGAFSDVIAPQIFVPGPISVLTGPGATTCSVVVGDAQLGNATAKDNCEVHITRTGVPAGNLFPVGTTTITYTATDGAGNTASASQTVTVVDNTPPTIAAPANVVVATGAGATTCGAEVSDTQLGSATASDNCTVTVSRLGVPSGNMFIVGTTTVTYTATDGSGNSVSATQTVTVIDNTPPTIAACPQNITVIVSYDQTGAAVSWPEPTASDNCGATLTSNYASGATFPPGTTTVTYTASDPAGNTASCSFTVTVNRSPNCTAAPSIAELWPPNHKMVNITIQGVTDPDGDPVTITITKITQDEPLNTLGDGNTEPDGAGVGTSIAQVRAERSGTPRVPGNGRVYRITYSASDGRGGECTGSVAVCVPHDQGGRSVCIDDGQKYNSVTGEIEAPLATNGTMELGGNGNERRPAFLPTEYALADAYPNPFNPTTTIQYDVPELTHVRLTVYDMLGREVMVLVDGDREAGRYSVTMNADGLRSGVYVYRFHTGKFTQTRKIVLMK